MSINFDKHVDWSKVSVDTPVFVTDDTGIIRRRHFARAEGNTVYTWGDGATSWSVSNPENTVMWSKATLADIDTSKANPAKHGQWDGWGVCSCCGLPWDCLMQQNAQDDGFFDPMPPYCPNCGAIMDLE